MSTKIEGTIAVLAALLVLFSAMGDPRASVAVSVGALLALDVYQVPLKYVSNHGLLIFVA